MYNVLHKRIHSNCLECYNKVSNYDVYIYIKPKVKLTHQKRPFVHFINYDMRDVSQVLVLLKLRNITIKVTVLLRGRIT